MNTIASLFKWVGYVVGLAALGLYTFIVTMPCQSCGTWDYIVIPIALIAVPVVSLILAFKWPLIAGEALIAAGFFVGWDIINLNLWVAALYALPLLVAGFAFLLAGILSLIKEFSSL